MGKKKQGEYLYDEELRKLVRLYIIINNEDFSSLENEEIEKLKTIVSNTFGLFDNALEIIKFLKEQSILKKNNNKKENILNSFCTYKTTWEKQVLTKIAQKLSVPEEEIDKCVIYMNDKLAEGFEEWEEIVLAIKNKKYIDYNPQSRISMKNAWHYIWLVLKEIITVIAVLLIYSALAQYGPFENIAMSILFLIYYNLSYNRLIGGLLKIIEIRELYKHIRKFQLLLNDIPSKEENEESKKVNTEQEKYTIDAMIVGFFSFILYCIVLYNLFIQLF